MELFIIFSTYLFVSFIHALVVLVCGLSESKSRWTIIYLLINLFTHLFVCSKYLYLYIYLLLYLFMCLYLYLLICLYIYLYIYLVI